VTNFRSAFSYNTVFFVYGKFILKRLKKWVTSLGGFEMTSNDAKLEVSFTVYVRREGRVTVPKEVMDAYDIEEDNLVECHIKKIR